MLKIIKSIFFTVGLLLVVTVTAQEKRNLLTDFYTRKFVNEAIAQDNSWIKYPRYKDRESWGKIPENIRKKTIAEGEKFLGYAWPAVTITMYLEFSRSGDRTAVDSPNGERSKVLQSLVLAELMEGKGRFLDDIVNGVFSFCEQTYWGSSAHFYMYGGEVSDPTTIVPDLDNPIVDLVVGDRASDLSWIWYYFHEEFDKISPVISVRLKDEIKRKVLNPFYDRYDYWWITGWGEGRVNNWNPWCNYNLLTSILLIEDDLQKKQDAIYKTMASVDLFINSYPEDGGCSEGPSYWGVAGGKLFDYLDLLKSNTKGKIDIFSNELVKNMGRYIYRAYVGDVHYFINFADAPFKINQDPGKIYRFGKRIGDAPMESFGAFLLEKSGYGENRISGKIGETLENLFNIEGWKAIPPVEPLLPEFYFPDLDIVTARETANTHDGFYFAAKGGSNGEGHNHNDVGSFMLYYNGYPVLIDVGVGTYTKETFSPQRYNIWTMQSNYHNLPVINGIAQHQGGQYKAKNSKFTPSKSKIFYSADIAGAYTEEAKVDSWIRSYTLERGKKFTIKDGYRLSSNSGGTKIHFMSGISCQVLKPGTVEFEGEGFTLQMKYDPSALDASVETIAIDDERLRHSLGNEISRVVFDLKGDELSGNISFEVVEKKLN